MYEVVNQRTTHSAKHYSERQHLPRLKPTLLNRNWSKIRPQSGLVSVDFVTPYSIVVRSTSINVVTVFHWIITFQHPQCTFDDRNHVEYGLRIVSKGAEVMRIPKIHIRSLTTQSCWKLMMQKSLEAKR